MKPEVAATFARGKWDESKWLKFKSLRFDYVHGFRQLDDCILNESPEGVSDEELYEKHVTEVYSSMVYPQKFDGTVEIASTMSFDHLMAPLIVLTPELDTDDQGRYVFKQHYEVVLYNEGLNVWHYDYSAEGKLSWHLAAFARRAFEPKKPYTLKVKMQSAKKEMRMTIECDGVVVGFEDPCLPRSFYAGITGCEGRNRFYDFSLATSDEVFDPSKDGEH